MISVQLLGGASLRSGDTPVSGPPAQRHRIALLTLIVAAWPQPLSRDRAMALLWPERDVAGARRLLNLAVHVLRAALGEDAIVSTGDGLLLDPSRLDCDLQQLRAALAARPGAVIVEPSGMEQTVLQETGRAGIPISRLSELPAWRAPRYVAPVPFSARSGTSSIARSRSPSSLPSTRDGRSHSC